MILEKTPCPCAASSAMRVHGWSKLQTSRRGRARAVSRTRARYLDSTDRRAIRRNAMVGRFPGRSAARPDQGGADSTTMTCASPPPVSSKAGAVLGITRANQFPQVGAAGSLGNTRTQPFPGNPPLGSASIQASWILDFWGQYRRATEAARANLLASEFGEKAVRITLIADVANAYFQLREFDSQLEISNETVAGGQGDGEAEHHKIRRRGRRNNRRVAG